MTRVFFGAACVAVLGCASGATIRIEGDVRRIAWVGTCRLSMACEGWSQDELTCRTGEGLSKTIIVNRSGSDEVTIIGPEKIVGGLVLAMQEDDLEQSRVKPASPFSLRKCARSEPPPGFPLK